MTRLGQKTAVALATLVVATGLLMLAIWQFGTWQFTTFGTNYVPMAPSTAVFFVLLGSAQLARLLRTDLRAVTWLRMGACLLTLVASCLILGRTWLGFETFWEGWLLPASNYVGLIPVGKMAPLTAIAFLCTALALLLVALPWPVGRWIATGLAGLGCVIGVMVIAAYATGTPLNYSGTLVPMAFLTAGLFILVNLSLLLTGPVTETFARWLQLDATVPAGGPELRFVNLLTAGALLVAIMIGTVGFLFIRNEQSDARENVQRELGSVANLKVLQLEQWRNERLGEGRYLERTRAIGADIANLLAHPADPDAKDKVNGWLEPIKGGDRYDAVFLLDTDGVSRLALPRNPRVDRNRLQAQFATATGQAESFLTDLYIDTADGRPHLSLVVPIRASGIRPAGDRLAPLIGVVILRLDPAQALYPMLQSWPVASSTAETVLVRREGEEVVYLSALRHRPDSALTLRRSIHEPYLPAAQAAQGKFGVAEGRDYRGEPVITTVRQVPGTDWFLLAKIDQREVYAPIRYAAWKSVLLVLLLLCTVAITAVFLWRQRHHSTLLRLLAAEREQAMLSERLALVMQHASDIILLLDESAHIIEANERAVATYGYTLDELRRLPPGGLRLPESMGDFPKQLQLFDSSEGGRFETIHRRKDGTTFPVEVSGRLVTIGGARYVFGIYRDITQRRAHEAEIERLNRLYAVLSEINQVIVRASDRERLFHEACAAIVEHGRFALAWVGWLDAATGQVAPVAEAGDHTGYLTNLHVETGDSVAAQGPSGRAIREGSTQVCNDFHADPQTQPWHAAAKRAGIRASIALPVRLGGRPSAVLSVYAAEVGCFGAREILLFEEAATDLSFALDNLEREAARRQAEAALRESEHKLRLFIEHSPAAVAMLDRNLRYLVVSRRWLADYGQTGRDIIGRTHYEIFPEIPERWREIHRRCLAGATESCDEDPFPRADGRTDWVKWEIRPWYNAADEVAGLIIMSEVVTERKRAQDAIRESGERLRLALYAAGQGMFDLDLATGRAVVTPEYASMLGYDAATFTETNETWIARLHPDDRPAVVATFQDYIAGRLPEYSTEFRMQTQAGDWKWILSLGRIVSRDANGKPLRMLGTHTDITRRRQAEERARRWEQVFVASEVGLAHVSATDNTFIEVNPSFAHRLGYTPEELKGRSVQSLHAPSEQAAVRVFMRSLDATGHGLIETSHLHKNGRAVPVMLEVTLIRDERGRPLSRIVYAVDLTTQQQAEAAQRETEERLRVIGDNLPDSYMFQYTHEATGAPRFLYLSSGVERVHGLTAAEILRDASRLFGQMDPAQASDLAAAELASAQALADFQMEVRIRREDQGRWRWLQLHSRPRRGRGGQVFWDGVATDITRLKVAVEAAQRGRAQLEAVFAGVPDGVVVTDMTGNFVFVNEAQARLSAFASVAELSRQLEFYVRVYELRTLAGELVPVEQWPLSRILRGETVRNLELRARRTDLGRDWIIEFNGQPIRDANGTQNMALIVSSDITPRKQAEAEIRRAEIRYRALIENSPDGVVLISADGRFLYSSAAALRLMGYTAEQVADRRPNDLTHPKDLPAVLAALGELIARPAGPVTLQYRFQHADGGWRWLESTFTNLLGEPSVAAIVINFRDITAQREAAAALRETSQYLDNVINSASAPIVVWDPLFRITRFNRAFEELTGRRVDEVLGRDLPILFPPDQVGELMQHIRATLSGRRWESVEIPILHTDGSVRVVLWNSANVMAPDGTLQATVAQGQDITARKAAEQALRDGEERWRLALQGSAAGIWDNQITKGIAFYSDRSMEILGYAPGEIPQQMEAWVALIHPDDAPLGRLAMAEHLAGRKPYYEVEHRFRCKDGSYRWIASRGRGQFGPDGQLVRVAGTHVDIHERKLAEAALRESLREKVSLLNEVHHRVKNNLQVITSLLRLEAGRAADSGVRGVLDEMKGRIRSMALLHETLYRSGNLAEVDMSAYLRQLATQLFRGQGAANGAVRLKLALAPVRLEIDQAIPCGLIVNELAANSLKHAFPAGGEGEVRVQLFPPDADGAVVLRVADDGRGLPANLDPAQTGSLGLQLVSDLARQLQGRFEIGRPLRGSEFTITFVPKPRSTPGNDSPAVAAGR